MAGRIDLTIAVGGSAVLLRACSVHTYVFAVRGGCPLCQWQRERHNPRRHLRPVEVKR